MGKPREFPFNPKSNRLLQAGDFFGMPLPNELWACGLILGVPLHTRTPFIGGLVDWCGNEPPTCEAIEGLPVPVYHTHHVKTITNYRLSIEGNCSIDQSGFELHQQASYVYRGGVFEYKIVGQQDNSIPWLGAMSMGGLYARAIRLFGGIEDQEKIRLHLAELKAASTHQRNSPSSDL